MKRDYDDLSWSEYLRYIDDLRATACDSGEDYFLEFVIEECRDEYRLAWHDYVRDFE